MRLRSVYSIIILTLLILSPRMARGDSLVPMMSLGNTFDVTVQGRFEDKPIIGHIYLNDKDTGFLTPHVFKKLKPGKYNFTIKVEKLRPDSRMEELYIGRAQQLTVTLYPSRTTGSFVSLIFPLLLRAALMTLLLTVIAVSDGIIIGTICGVGRVAKNPIARALTGIYVDFVRGTPLLVQIFVVYFGMPPILGSLLVHLGIGDGSPIHIPPLPAAIAALSINSGAYITEIVRAGIQSIDRGQMEAARSLGMTRGQAMRYIILPQALKRVIPPLGNEFIAMLKDSSLVSVIAMEELVRKGQMISTTYYRPTETWLAVALVFLIMTLPFTRFVALLERRLKTGD